MTHSPYRKGFVAVWALFATHLLFVATLLPPWQNPDEPDHFAVVRTLSQQPSIDLAQRRNRATEAAVLASMAEHGWWEAYDERIPDPLPTDFSGVPEHIGAAYNGPALYYVSASRYLRMLGVEGLLQQYYALRFASLVLSLLTFAIVIRAAREWFDDRIALLAAAFMALVPQFGLIATSVGPDPLVFLAGAIVWWQAGRLAAGAGTVTPLLVMGGVTIVAVLAKRLAVPLILEAGLLVIIGAVVAPARRRLLLGFAVASLVLIVAGILVTGRLLARPNELSESVTTGSVVAAMAGRYLQTIGWNGQPFSLDYFLAFTWFMFESAYLVAGWLRFHAPAVVIALALATFATLIVLGFRATAVAPDRRIRLGAMAAAIAVITQLGAIYGTNYYLPGWGAQGRFMFPVIGPMAALCAVGVLSLKSVQARTLACYATVALMAILDLAAWTTTVIPAYVR